MMLKEHNASIKLQKNQKMFDEQEQPILVLISGNSSLTNQRLGRLSKGINDLKKSLEFSKSEYDEKFENMGHKVEKLEE